MEKLLLLICSLIGIIDEINCTSYGGIIYANNTTNRNDDFDTKSNGTQILVSNMENTTHPRFKRGNYENFSEKVIQMGDEVRFPCIIEKENITVLWIKIEKNNEHNITVNYTTVHMDKRFKQNKQNGSNNWELSIKYTQKSDEGLYLCKATTSPNVTKFYTKLILIEAVAHILDTNGNESGIIKVKLFSPLRLSCVLYNSISPPFYIFWYHYDTMINYDLEDNASVRHGRQGSELIFPKTEAMHQGNYSCVPSNAKQASIVVEIYGEMKRGTANKTAKSSKNLILSFLFATLFIIW